MNNHLKKAIIPLLLLVFVSQINAQQHLLNQVDNRIVYEKLDTVTKQARVKSYDFKPKKHRLYYWYWKNTFQQNYGGFEGVLLDGDYIVFDKKENLIEKAVFKKGVVKGKFLYWNQAGILIKSERWKSGVKSGVYKIYNDKGELIEKGINHRGKKNGISRYFIEGKKYKTQRFKNDKLKKDISGLKKEKEDIYIEKKKERTAKAQEKKKESGKLEKKTIKDIFSKKDSEQKKETKPTNKSKVNSKTKKNKKATKTSKPKKENTDKKVKPSK